MKVLSENKKAFYEYEILKKYEAGIVLNGQEVKSVKNGRMSLKGSYVTTREEELFLIGASIPPYQPANVVGEYNEERSRKLLLRKQEIKELIGKSKQKGLTMVPTRVYTVKGKVKIEFALAKGKREIDKREKIKRREEERNIRREIKKRRY